MLRKLRKPALIKEGGLKKLFAYLFFALICLILVLFMPITSYISPGGGAVAYVGKEAVSSRELRELIRNLQQQSESQLSSASAEESRRLNNEIAERALQSLIGSHIVFQRGEREGFFVSDQALRAALRSIEAFQDRGRFIYSRYQEYLRQQRMRPGVFESRIRRHIANESLRGLFQTALQYKGPAPQNPFQMTVRTASLKKLKIEDEEKLGPLLQDKSRRKEALRFLKQLKVSWKTIKAAASYNSSSQFEGGESLFQAVTDYAPQLGFVPPGIIFSSQGPYAAEILNVRKTSAKPAAEAKAGSLPFDFSRITHLYAPLRLFSLWVEEGKNLIAVKEGPAAQTAARQNL